MDISLIIKSLKNLKTSKSKDINIALGYYQIPKSYKQAYVQGKMKKVNGN